jgi:acyl-CoA thioesterase-1
MDIVRPELVWMTVVGLPLVAVLGACGSNPRSSPANSGSAAPEAGRAPATSEPDGRPAIVAFGDSLTAGHGVEPGQSYPDCLQRLIDAKKLPYQVINAGLSGDTTSGGLVRLEGVIGYKPRVVILEFGGNDGLRGLPLDTTRANLEEMIVKLKAAGAEVVLAGMTLPPNYGPEYIAKFEQIYRDLAKTHKLTLIPFLLEGVGGVEKYMQPDGLHPNAAGCARVAAMVMRYLEPLLRG